MANQKNNTFRDHGTTKLIENSLNNIENKAAFKLISELRASGHSYSSIATELDKAGFKTRRGKEYSKGSVKQLYDRFLKYYDPEINEYKKGLVSIGSTGEKSFAYLSVLSNGKVSLESNFEPFKSFDFILKEDEAVFAERAIKAISRAYANAKEKIIVSNFLHPKSLIIESNTTYDNEYFQSLESALKENQVKYQRHLQLPEMIWKYIPKPVLPYIPLESLVIAITLLPDSIANHIHYCYREIEDFHLYIIRKQRTYSTFASIDSNILIEEEFLTDENGLAEPSDIKIFRAKNTDSSDDIFNYIRRKKEVLNKMIVMIDQEPISKKIYKLIFNLTSSCKANDFHLFSSIYNSISTDNLEDVVDSTKKVFSASELWNKIKKVLEGIEAYRAECENENLPTKKDKVCLL